MSKIAGAIGILSFAVILAVTQAVADDQPVISSKVHAFYYPWYGNPKVDGRFAN